MPGSLLTPMLCRGPSIGKRNSGRLQPSTPTIQEFEESRDELLDTDTGPELLVRNDSLGAKSTGSLHRATPVPGDLPSSSSSGGKFSGHRLSTPTIKENENDRCGHFTYPKELV